MRSIPEQFPEHVWKSPEGAARGKQAGDVMADALIEMAKLLGPSLERQYDGPRGLKWCFWKFVHNALVHPLLALPYEPRWAQRLHDWTAER